MLSRHALLTLISKYDINRHKINYLNNYFYSKQLYLGSTNDSNGVILYTYFLSQPYSYHRSSHFAATLLHPGITTVPTFLELSGRK